MTRLITETLDIWSSAQKPKKTGGRGRGKTTNGGNLYGIKKLRELILELAVRGKLVPQNPNDEPASELLKKIAQEKAKLVQEGKIKKQKKLPEIGEDEKPFELPEGWKFCRFGSLVNSIQSGGTPSKRNLLYWNGDIPWASVKDLGKSKYLEDTQDHITREGLNAGSKLADPDDVIICTRMGLGKIAIAKGPIAINQDLKAVKLTSFLDVNFFLFFFSTLTIKGTGTTVAGIRQDELLNYMFFLPPLAEQLRIVAKVDELMALCDRLEEQQTDSAATHQTLLETLLATLTNAADHNEFNKAWQRLAHHFDTLFTTEKSIDQLKQTILQLAVMGKLVRQDPNDEPASELLKKITLEKARLIKEGKIKKQKPLPEIREEEKPFQLPEGWEWVTFDYIAENAANSMKAGPFGSALKKSMYVEKGFKIYGQEQVISGDENFGDYFIDKEKYDALKSCAVKPGDILISLVGTIGKVLVLSDQCHPGIINPRLVKLSLYQKVYRRYIQTILASPLIQQKLAEKSHGGTMNILNLGLIRSVKFPLPPLAEQHRIIAKVDELMTLCDTLKDRLTEAQTTQLQLADTVVNLNGELPRTAQSTKI